MSFATPRRPRGLSRLLAITAGLVVSLSWAPAVFAAAGGPALTETWLGLPRWVWLTANLVVFWGALIKFAGPPVRRFLDARADQITENLANAKKQRDDVLGMKASLESRIAELEVEMEEMVARGERTAEQEKVEILEQAKVESDRLVQQTQEEINSRVGVAKKELQAHAALLATGLAAERLTSKIGGDDHNRLFDEALERLKVGAS